jgi:hypothetical protein
MAGDDLRFWGWGVPAQFRQALGAMKRTLLPEGSMNPGVQVD